jgi:hypothetical protein
MWIAMTFAVRASMRQSSIRGRFATQTAGCGRMVRRSTSSTIASSTSRPIRATTRFSDRATLEALGMETHLAALAAAIPRTIRVSADNADELWRARRNYFFKPAAGHGAKAVYRGDKLTRSVWQQIVAGDYVAQEVVPPGERVVDADTSAS